MVHIERAYVASPASVRRAWTVPELMRRWLFVGDESVIEDVSVELRPGGRFRILERQRGGLIDHFGRYETVGADHLAFTLEVPKHFAGVTLVSLDFAPAAQGCHLTLLQSGVDASVTERPWKMMLGTLAATLASPLSR